MAASSFQTSSSESQSSSGPVITRTPQSDFTLQLAQLLEQLGMSQQAWALQEYARAGGVTDAQINNYIALAQQGSDLAGSTLGRYNQTFAPLEDQYAREAQTYDSDARRRHEMGAAEARAMQAQNAAKINAENELESFGIDPSSGRYQDLVQANATKAAADAAAAGEQARIATEQEGQRRKVNAIMMGQQLPGVAVNALNSAYQGVAGAVNSALGLANTGVNLTTSSSKFFDPAMRPLQPLQGQAGQSTGRSGSQGGSVNSGGGSSGKTSDPFNSDRFGRSSPSRGTPNTPGGYAPQNVPGYQARPATYQAPNAGIRTNPDGSVINDQDPWGGQGGWPSLQPGSNWDASGFSDPSGMDVSSVYDQNGYQNPGWWDGGLGSSQNFDYGSGGLPYYTGQDPNQGQTLPGWGDYSQPTPYDWPSPNAAWNTGGSYDWNQSYSDPYAGSYGSNYYGQSSYSDPWSSAPSYDYNSSYSDPYSSAYPSNSGWDSGGYDSGGYDYYAKGGPVQQGQRPLPRGNNPQGGGFVPPSMSPSRGQRTDDIQAVIPQTGGRAQINAGEFVLPRDVVAWKGQEFFQKMIQQARKARTGAPAKPSNQRPGGFNGR